MSPNPPLILASNPAPHVQPESLRAFLAADMRAVDEQIRQRLDSDVILVKTIAEYIVQAGGKRLRPALVLLAAGACGYTGNRHQALAAVVEFIHTATLLHDDVVDESELRRGRRTANAEFGNPASVLVGDFLYSRAFQMMVGVGSMRVMEVLADATNAIAEGEVLQLVNARNPDLSEAAYFDVIQRKTARLFEAAARLGAIVADATPEVENGLAEYGMHLGVAFQLIDDVLDYSSESAETGKNLGDDLAEGKMTLPLIHALKCADSVQAAVVRTAVENGGRDDLVVVMEAIRDTGALAVARTRAGEHARLAGDALHVLPDSSHRRCLLELTSFAVERSF